MKKFIVFVFLLFSMACMSQTKQTTVPTKQEAAAKLAPEWQSYVSACIADSSLQIYWIYSGKEKLEVKMDSTIVKGKLIKVVTILPTQQVQWIRHTPDWKEFEEYLNPKSTTVKK